ncbi:MAG: hypothetical protein ABL903_18865 [Methylococcales bacterium]
MYKNTTETLAEYSTVSSRSDPSISTKSTDYVENVYIKNGKRYLASKYTSSNENGIFSTSKSTYEQISDHEPGQFIGPAVRLCKNQTWQTEPNIQTLTSTTDEIQTKRAINWNTITKFTIEKIDDVVTTPAGTFEAVRTRVEGDNNVIESWVSINKGVPVKSINTNKKDGSVSETVLTKIQYP